MNSRGSSIPSSFERESPFKALERKRRKRLLTVVSRTVARLAIPAMVLYLVVLVLQRAWQMGLAAFNALLLILIDQLVQRMARKGRLTAASYVMLISMLIIISVTTVIVEGLFPVLAPTLAAFVVIGGMLLGSTGGFVTAGAAFALWLAGFASTELALITPAPLAEPFPTILLIAISMLVFLLVAVVSQAATTDLHRALDEATFDLAQALRQIEEANNLKSQFMARTSHELRTPLNSLIGYTDLMLRNLYGPLTPRQLDAQERVLRNAKRLQALINDILDLTKIEAGQLELVDKPVEVRALTEAIRTVLEPTAREKGLSFSITANGLPRRVLMDENRVTQVMLNLIENAIKFTAHGSVTALLTREDESTWSIRVQDTGRGIHEKDFERIFDEFRQLDNTPDASSGAGLGLAITRQLVQMMKGEINVSSQIGKGTTFEVLLPLRIPEPAGMEIGARE